MKIIVDGHGGDNAPLSVVEGCALALKDNVSVDIVCVGNTTKLKKIAKDNNISLNGFRLVNADDMIPQNAQPTDILKKYSECSMAVGLRLLADGDYDAFISAGSTGALVVGGAIIVGRKTGVRRPAIATILPSNKGEFMLLDSGANHDCNPEILQQFAQMGSIMMGASEQIEKPRVGLLNIGVESVKGTSLQKETYELLISDTSVNFIGNVEPSGAFEGVCDVLVADGFCGNIFLKSTEAVSRMLMLKIRDVFSKNLATKLAGAMVKNDLKLLRSGLSPANFGGAPLVGLKKLVIKAHGSSDSLAIKNAIVQGKKLLKQN